MSDLDRIRARHADIPQEELPLEEPASVITYADRLPIGERPRASIYSPEPVEQPTIPEPEIRAMEVDVEELTGGPRTFGRWCRKRGQRVECTYSVGPWIDADGTAGATFQYVRIAVEGRYSVSWRAKDDGEPVPTWEAQRGHVKGRPGMYSQTDLKKLIEEEIA